MEALKNIEDAKHQKSTCAEKTVAKEPYKIAQEVESKGSNKQEEPTEVSTKGPKAQERPGRELKKRGSQVQEEPSEVSTKGPKAQERPGRELKKRGSQVQEEPRGGSRGTGSKEQDEQTSGSKIKDPKVQDGPNLEPKRTGSQAQEEPCQQETKSGYQKIQQREANSSVVKNRWNKKSKTRRNSINTLVEIQPAGVNAMEELQEWEEIEMAVDSGATETVVGEDMIKGVETKLGEATR